ncbi:MAG: methyltransferase [Candidatus Phosphoribacter sp.]
MSPTPIPDTALLTRLRADLAAAAYTVDGVDTALGPVAAGALHREQRLPADLATRGSSEPVAVLVRLLALGFPVAWDDADRALPTLRADGAAALGLARAEGADLRATCDLRPYAADGDQWWVASDLSEIATGAPLAETHVLGIGNASTTLAEWTIRRPARRALDIGVGSAVQSLHLAAHCQDIVGTDLSARALAFARFNAALNGLDIDLREGSLLDPVAGERFDLVVSNPPFVITPRSGDVPRYEYRDGGLVGDGVVEALVREVGAHLEPGGVAQFLGNWEIRRGAQWRERWREWLAGSALDAWVIQRDVQDPAEYAELWARDAGARSGAGPTSFEHLYAAWLADFADRDVEGIGFGIVTLQRPSIDRESWVELDEVAGPVAPGVGHAIDAGLRARTALAEGGPAYLLETAWTVAPDVTEERHSVPGAPDPAVILARQGAGLRRVIQLDTVTAGLLGVCDGTLTARAGLDAISHLLDTDPEQTAAGALPALSALVRDGFLR